MKKKSMIKDGTVEIDGAVVAEKNKKLDVIDAKAVQKDKVKDITQDKLREANGEKVVEEKEIQG